jgi:hypothetical protein
MLHTRRAASRDDPRVDQARHFVHRLQESLAGTPRRLPVDGLDRITATDRTATVTCVVDVRGTFVDLSVGPDWWHTVGVMGFGPAVLDAVQFAENKAMLAMALLRRHGRPAPAPTGSAFLVADPAPNAPEGASAEWAAAQAKVERGYTLMKLADRVAEVRDSPQPRTISGPRGLFRLRLTGFTVTHAEVTSPGLSTADTDGLTEDARAALRQATWEQDPAYWLTGQETRR